MSRPLRVAIVGAGPAGLYAAGHLLEGPGGTYLDGRLQQLVDRPVEVDVLDRLPTPWGLVRYGVAPDHPDKKLVQRVFEENAARPGFRFFGNVEVGNHVRPAELSQWYDAVIYAIGASGDAPLGIPGEDLPGSISARSFVAWYNGHPDHAGLEPDLSCARAVIVGNGNVALDVARILTRPVETLARTDIASYALQALAESKVRQVVVLGRRAHFHGAFNNPELEELGRLPSVDVVVERGDLLDDDESVLDELDEITRRKVSTLRRYAAREPAGHARRIVLRFLSSPLEILGPDRVSGLLIARNRLVGGAVTSSGEESILEAGLVLRAIGYFGTPLPGLPFDADRGVIPNSEGRVQDLTGVYVTGWARRGPRGIIGTNKKCARDTVLALLADARAGRLDVQNSLSAAGVESVLRQRQPALVDQRDWLLIDNAERCAGRAEGRPRVKRADLKPGGTAARLSCS